MKDFSGVSLKSRLLALTEHNRHNRKARDRDKHPSLLKALVNYGDKKYYKIGPNFHKTRKLG